MIQLGRQSARGAALRGLGWKASAGFSIATLKNGGAKAIREARLKAAIRRMKYREAETK